MTDPAPSYPISVPQTARTPPPPLRLLPRDTPAEYLARVAHILTDAFASEQISRLLSGAVPGLPLARMVRIITTGTLDLETYVVEGEGEVLGVMVLKPPGFEHRSSPNSEGPHADEANTLAQQAPELEEGYTKLKKVISELEIEAFGPREVTDIYYISHIGVTPSAQGMGVGKAFCEYAVCRGREEGIAVSLLTMTARHVEYYERFGFRTRAYREVELQGEVTKWWAMSTDV